jgi:hypothetical protein
VNNKIIFYGVFSIDMISWASSGYLNFILSNLSAFIFLIHLPFDLIIDRLFQLHSIIVDQWISVSQALFISKLAVAIFFALIFFLYLLFWLYKRLEFGLNYFTYISHGSKYSLYKINQSEIWSKLKAQMLHHQ